MKGYVKGFHVSSLCHKVIRTEVYTNFHHSSYNFNFHQKWIYSLLSKYNRTSLHPVTLHKWWEEQEIVEWIQMHCMLGSTPVSIIKIFFQLKLTGVLKLITSKVKLTKAWIRSESLINDESFSLYCLNSTCSVLGSNTLSRVGIFCWLLFQQLLYIVRAGPVGDFWIYDSDDILNLGKKTTDMSTNCWQHLTANVLLTLTKSIQLILQELYSCLYLGSLGNATHVLYNKRS